MAKKSQKIWRFEWEYDVDFRNGGFSIEFFGWRVEISEFEIFGSLRSPNHDPYAPCMEYFPTLALKITQM